MVTVMLDHNDEYIYDSRDIWNVIREIPTEDELKEYYKEYLEECLWDRIDTEVAICREAVENGKEGKVAGYTFTPVSESRKSRARKSSRKSARKSVGDSFVDEDGTVSYVSEGRWNFILKPLGGGRYEVIFLNGGFIGGEPVSMCVANSLEEAADKADLIGIGLSQYA